MKGTISYDGKHLRKLQWWKCDHVDPYDQWGGDTRVGVHCAFVSEYQKRLFRSYCRRKDRYGMYYDLLEVNAISFDPKHIQTVFKLYGKRSPLGGPDLVSELVRILDNQMARGGFIWVKKLQKKLGLLK